MSENHQLNNHVYLFWIVCLFCALVVKVKAQNYGSDIDFDEELSDTWPTVSKTSVKNDILEMELEIKHQKDCPT